MTKAIKKTIVTILLLCTALSFACFAACSEGNPSENPINPSQPEHTCSFVLEKTEEKYLKSAATCTDKAVYYKSCSCGEMGTEIFEYGEAKGHSYANYINDNNATCENNATETATCDNGCGTTDTRTIENTALGHEFTDYISDNNATYDSDGTKTANCNRTDCSATDTVTDVGSKLQSSLSFNTLTVDGDKVFGTVPNSTESFSFIDEVKVEGKMEFIVSLNEYGTQTVITKKIGLDEGNNKVYVIEVLDGKAENIYEVTIRRRPMYTVTFNTNGGTAVESQTVEEDSFITAPTTSRPEYKFVGWDYDFNNPITKDTIIAAKWKSVADINYYEIGINYYLIVDGKDGSQKSHTVTTDKVYEEPPKSCTFNASSFYNDIYYDLKYVLDGNDKTVKVNEDGDFTLTVSDYSEWKSGVKTHYLPGVYKVVLHEKRHDDPVNIYLGYVGVDKEGNCVSGIDKETELKTTVKVGETLPENAFTASDIEGYTFKGYYYVSISNKKAENSTIANYMVDYNLKESHYGVWEFAGMGSDFHLSTYNIDPTSETLEFTVIAVYEVIKSDVNVKIYKNGQFTELERTIESGLTHDYKLSDLKGKIVEYNDSMKFRYILKNTEFIGWSTTENGTGGIHTFAELESSDIKINTDMTIYLFYKTKAKIVLHNYEKPDVGREEITAKDGNDLYYGDSYTLPTTLPQNGRFTFEGWYKDETMLSRVSSVTLDSDTVHIYAKWNAQENFVVKYYITRERYVNYKNYPNLTAEYKYNEDLTLSGEELVRLVKPNGYTFSGWFVLDESGKKLNDNPVTSLASQTYESDLSLIAAYSIDVKLIYGSNAFDRTLYYQESCALPIPTTTDNSKEFNGWSTKRTDGTMVSEKDGSVESFSVIFDAADGNFLYETWATKTFTVNFYQHDSSSDSKTVEYGGTITAPVADGRTGYTFKGWYATQEGGEKFDPTSGVTSNKNYYAQYTANKYTVTLVVDGTTWKTYDVYYDQIATLPTPTNTGKYFAGWLYNSNVFTNADGKMLKTYDLTENITLNANLVA